MASWNRSDATPLQPLKGPWPQGARPQAPESRLWLAGEPDARWRCPPGAKLVARAARARAVVSGRWRRVAAALESSVAPLSQAGLARLHMRPPTLLEPTQSA